MHIPLYKTIQELHTATGYDKSPVIKGFHIFRHESTYPSVREYMPPFRKDFYQITLLENPGKSFITINTHKIEPKNDIIYFHGPQHIFSFKRDSKLRGFIIYFTKDFIRLYPKAVSDFSFFEIGHCNVFSLCDKQKRDFKQLMGSLLGEQNNNCHFNMMVIQAQLLALLFKAKGLFTEFNKKERSLSRPQFITDKFKRLVDGSFLKNKSVEYYAVALTISAKHLSDVIKTTTGKTPRQIISERILIEAKNLLRFSDLNVSEISFQLGFADATAFGKFFKKQIGSTPIAFRNS